MARSRCVTVWAATWCPAAFTALASSGRFRAFSDSMKNVAGTSSLRKISRIAWVNLEGPSSNVNATYGPGAAIDGSASMFKTSDPGSGVRRTPHWFSRGTTGGGPVTGGAVFAVVPEAPEAPEVPDVPAMPVAPLGS